MKFVFPNINYKDKAKEFIHEFLECGSEINGSGALDWYLENSTYEAWLEKVLADIDIANIPQPTFKETIHRYVIRR